MKLKINKPTTPSQRQLIRINRCKIRNKPLLKNKIKRLIGYNGRNNSGKIVVRHKGGGHKQKHRKINFFRVENTTSITCSIEYDPIRTACIASIYNFELNKFCYIIAPKNLKIGDIISSGQCAEIKIGHSLPLYKIPVGSYIHNISPTIAKQAQMSRSSGTFSLVTEKKLNYAKIKLSSGKHKYLQPKCYATIGIVSNELNFLSQSGKAGQSRWLNKRPTVRGVAMNPIDHPHGGGEGKKSGKGYNFWGKPTKSGKTGKKLKLN